VVYRSSETSTNQSDVIIRSDDRFLNLVVDSDSIVSKIYMLNFVLWLVFFCPHTDKHLAVLSKRTFDTQSIHIFGLVLEVEKGRHQNIPFVNCKLEIEDEIHLLLQCPILNSFRTEAMQQISDICKIFASFIHWITNLNLFGYFQMKI
jgi:hypothetical protein